MFFFLILIGIHRHWDGDGVAEMGFRNGGITIRQPPKFSNPFSIEMPTIPNEIKKKINLNGNITV